MASLLRSGILQRRGGFGLALPSFRSLSSATEKPSIVVVGANVIDQIAYVPRLPRPGETLHGSDYRTGFGGKGANQAVAAKRLLRKEHEQEIDVAIVTCVGNDNDGRATLDNFKQNGVSCEFVSVVEDRRPTGVAPIAVDTNSGENSIVVVMGANDALSPTHLARDTAAVAAIASATVVLCQMEIPRETTLEALRVAKSGGGCPPLTVWNTAPAPTNPPLTEKEAAEFFALADIVCPNWPELSQLAPEPLAVVVSNGAEEETSESGSGCKASEARSAVARAAGVLLTQGAKRVLVTLGGDGAMLVSLGPIAALTDAESAVLFGGGGGEEEEGVEGVTETARSSISELIEMGRLQAAGPDGTPVALHWAFVGSNDVAAIDTVGAGDTFMGAFVASFVSCHRDQRERLPAPAAQLAPGDAKFAMIDDRLVLAAMLRANAAAGISVTRQGTQTATPYTWELPF